MMALKFCRAWVNRPQNEWVRAYKDKAELDAKNKEFLAAVAAGVKLGGSVAKMEVRGAESAFA